MNSIFIMVILIIIFGVTFDFINGFHDIANTIATAVSTRALSPRIAIALAAFLNFIGTLLFTGVAQRIIKGIVHPHSLEHGSFVVLAALLSAIIWNLITWYLGIPSSSTHGLIGSMTGAAIASGDFHALNYHGIINIIEALIFSPVMSIIVGFMIMSLFGKLFKNFPLSRTNRGFRIFQIFTASLQSFAHGTNDAQKTMGLITLALMAGGFQSSSEVPIWVRLMEASAMGIGAFIGGWRIIKTIGTKIMKLRPVNGAAADLSSAMVIFGSTALKLPVSTTHVISSSIMGVGSAQSLKDVKWGTAIRIVVTWVITLPMTALLSACVCTIMMIVAS